MTFQNNFLLLYCGGGRGGGPLGGCIGGLGGGMLYPIETRSVSNIFTFFMRKNTTYHFYLPSFQKSEKLTTYNLSSQKKIYQPKYNQCKCNVMYEKNYNSQ